MAARDQIRKVLTILLVFGIAGGIVVLFVYMQRTVEADANKTGPLVIANVPDWVDEILVKRIFDSAGGREFPLNQKSLLAIYDQLQTLSWIDQPKLQITQDAIALKVNWRKPIALVHSGTTKFYVDVNSVALDHVDLPKLSLITIRGVRMTRPPVWGTIVEKNDLLAAVKILMLLEHMDKTEAPNKPLLGELDRIDVSNFQGRKQASESHIVLYSQEDTPIYWGAEFGEYTKFLEPSDDIKLARLYTYYLERGNFTGVKWVDLRLLDELPQPAQPNLGSDY